MLVRAVEAGVDDLGPGARVGAWLGGGREVSALTLSCELAAAARRGGLCRLSVVAPRSRIEVGELLELVRLARPSFEDVCVFSDDGAQQAQARLGERDYRRLREAVDVWVRCPRLDADATGPRALGPRMTWQPSWLAPGARVNFACWATVGDTL